MTPTVLRAVEDGETLPPLDTTAVYGAPEVLAYVPGLSYRQLDHWQRCGHITPLPRRAGQGHPREWHGSEVQTIRRMLQLVRAGLTVPAAGRIARTLADANYVLEGDDVRIVFAAVERPAPAAQEAV